jgi:hypothetical protein
MTTANHGDRDPNLSVKTISYTRTLRQSGSSTLDGSLEIDAGKRLKCGLIYQTQRQFSLASKFLQSEHVRYVVTMSTAAEVTTFDLTFLARLGFCISSSTSVALCLQGHP